MKKMIVLKIDRCLGCKSCELACAAEHSEKKDLSAAVLAGERVSSMVSVLACRGRAVPIHCSHCEDSPCALACPTGAISRKNPEDPVLVDSKLCIGCRMCVQVCPFGMIIMDPSGKGAVKCDLCIERIEQGGEPACAAACPTGALVFGEEQAVVRNKRGETASRILDGSLKEKEISSRQ